MPLVSVWELCVTGGCHFVPCAKLDNSCRFQIWRPALYACMRSTQREVLEESNSGRVWANSQNRCCHRRINNNYVHLHSRRRQHRLENQGKNGADLTATNCPRHHVTCPYRHISFAMNGKCYNNRQIHQYNGTVFHNDSPKSTITTMLNTFAYR